MNIRKSHIAIGALAVAVLLAWPLRSVAVQGYNAITEYGVRWLPISRSSKPDNCTSNKPCTYLDSTKAPTFWDGTTDWTLAFVSPSPSATLVGEVVQVDASGHFTISNSVSITQMTIDAIAGGMTITANGAGASTYIGTFYENTTLSAAITPRQLPPFPAFQGHVWNTTSVSDNTGITSIIDAPQSGAVPYDQLIFKTTLGLDHHLLHLSDGTTDPGTDGGLAAWNLIGTNPNLSPPPGGTISIHSASVAYHALSKTHADSPVTGTITDGILYIDSSGGVVTYTLPAPATAGAGWPVTITDSANSANTITVASNASEKINFVAGNYTLPQGTSKTFSTNGTDWFVR